METRICISIVFSYLKVEESLYPKSVIRMAIFVVTFITV